LDKPIFKYISEREEQIKNLSGELKIQTHIEAYLKSKRGRINVPIIQKTILKELNLNPSVK
jgi:hypothetical protein